MICRLDIGNSRLKWRIDDAEPVSAAGTAEAFISACDEHSVKRVSVSCVAPAAHYTELWTALRQRDIVVEHARVMQDFAGLRLAYEDTQKLGVDRWLAMLAARALCGDSALTVICAGTAITVDYIDMNGRHMGGLIIPGVRVSSAALFARTNNVGAVEISLPKNWQPGGTTLDCVEHGFSALYSGFLAQALDSKHSLNATIIISGGDAHSLQQLIGNNHSVQLESALVLDGLKIVFPA